jgi:hypothetical protein
MTSVNRGMRYQDPANGRPPWEDADYSDYGRQTGPQASAFQPVEEFRRNDEFWSDEFPRERPHGEFRGRRGNADTSADLFTPAERATINGRFSINGLEYGVTAVGGGDSAAGTGPQPRHARGRQGAARQDPGRLGAGRRSRGLLAGGTSGFLAAALALGVANLAAAFVRPQASPIIAVGGAFIDRTPSWLKNFAVEKFGENDKNMLLLGLYVTIVFIAIAIGVIAWRHNWAGVAGIGAFGLFGAFVAYTRPESLPTDVIPSLAGGVAGIAAIICLARWSRGTASGGPKAYGEPRVRPVRSEWVA